MTDCKFICKSTHKRCTWTAVIKGYCLRHFQIANGMGGKKGRKKIRYGDEDYYETTR